LLEAFHKWPEDQTKAYVHTLKMPLFLSQIIHFYQENNVENILLYQQLVGN
jgi:hypothetical protein